MTVKIKDKGYSNLKKAYEVANSKVVEVGFIEGTSDFVLYKAVTNEFGDGVPERSFIRSTFNENTNEMKKTFKKLNDSISKGNYNVIQKLNLIGMKFTTLIQDKITNLKEPPNAPMTIALKGSSNPLIDKGEMREDVNYRIVNKRNNE